MQFTNRELVNLVRHFKKYSVINLASYVFADYVFKLPFIDYARIYISDKTLEIAKTKNIDVCKFVSSELELIFFENLIATPNKLNNADLERLTQRTHRLRNSSPHRTASMPGRDDWYTGVRTLCTMIYLPDVEELPRYRTEVQTIQTQGAIFRKDQKKTTRPRVVVTIAPTRPAENGKHSLNDW